MRCQGTPPVNSCQHASAIIVGFCASSSNATIVAGAVGRANRARRVALDARRRPERGLRDRDDRVGRPVVVHERDRAAAGEVPRELGERRRVGARERVDRLRAVADDAQVGAVAEPRAQQPGLERRRVLELVDEQVPEAPALGGREVGVALDRVGAPTEEIVEVEPALAALLGFVAGVELGELARPGAAAGARRRGPRRRTARAGSSGPSPTRSRPRRRRSPARPTRPTAPRAEQRPEHPALAVEDARRLLAAVGGAAAELGQRERVEGAGGDRAVDTAARRAGRRARRRPAG